jgi:hypothetical protein
MNSLIALSLAAVASALTPDKVDHAPQKPLFNDACPSNSILSPSGECQPSTVDTTSFKTNISQTLEQAHEAAQQSVDFPWTFWPECFSNENTTNPYCVFSHQEFANGRGIFIVTTSEKAYELLKKPAFSDPDILERINQHANPPFVQHEFPGKGRGLVANKTLNRGDQIFASTPLLISNPDAYELVNEERLALSHRGVETLPEKSQELFWALLDHFKGDPVDDRINTNAFEVEINNHMQHAVFPEIAMLNHDCRPNAAYFWDEETLSHYVHATQTIHPGEEITITYINNERSRAKRVANLARNWGFQCSCSSCSAHPAFTAESDSRIEQMNALAEKLNDWTAESTANPDMAELLISLYIQERLFASLGVAYKHAAEVYSSFGDKFNAIRNARMATEYSLLDKGFRDRDVREMKAMANEPEMTWSWNKRVGLAKAAGACRHAH